MFIKAAYPFLIYTIPENFLTCLVFCLLFRVLSQYKISQHLRKFYFLKTIFAQTLIEGNVIYFTYVCFSHLGTSFFWRFGDKVSLVFTIVLLWGLILFTLVYYPLVGYFLRQKASYFIYCYYRCNSGYFFLNVKNLGRNFLRGAVFYFVDNFFLEEIALLCLIEAAVIVLTIYLESHKKIFLNKIFYLLWLTYHFLFVLLNLALYLWYAGTTAIFEGESLKQIALEIQSTFIYLLVINIILIMVSDLLPLSWLKPEC